MNPYDNNHIKLITSIEDDDADGAARIFEERFDKRLLGPVGVLRVYAVQLAAWRGRIELLELLHARGADVNATDKIGRSALFHAAHRGNAEVVYWLLEHGALVDSRVGIDSCAKRMSVSSLSPCFIGRDLPTPECWGRTALHQAVKNNHSTVVKLLVDAGADVNSPDDRGVTPLLLAGSTVTRDDINEMSKFNEIIHVLVSAKASTNVIHPDTGTTVLHTAAELGSASATKKLLDSGGAWPLYRCKSTGGTPLHLAASTGNTETLSILLDSVAPNHVDIQDNVNRTPLHRAAYQGHRECVQLLIDHGGNLAAETRTGVTVVDAIFAHTPGPVSLLVDILNSRVKMSRSLERDSHIVADFDVLTPKGELQMAVITSLIEAAADVKQLTILQHPLVETFLWLRWSKLRVFFLSLVFVHGLLVLSLSAHSVIIVQHEADCSFLRRILASCSCVLFAHNVAQVLLVPRYYFKQFETWLTFACAALSLAISLNNGRDAAVSGGDELNGARHPPQWMLHSISLAILLAWMQMMLLVGRLPMCGYYALMFSTVLKNILKVLLAFVCLIVGFAFSFAVLFHGNDQFRNSWRAVVKTVVMMMGEYEYGALFTDERNGSFFLPATSRVVFLAFVMLASIVLMNLMIGLAVNDIQGLEKEGHIRQLLKQAEFVGHLERLTSHRIFRGNWLHPRLGWLFDPKPGIPTKITFDCHERYRHESSTAVPARLREALLLLASRNHGGRERWEDPRATNTAKVSPRLGRPRRFYALINNSAVNDPKLERLKESRPFFSPVTRGKRNENDNRDDDNAELTALLEEVLLQLRKSRYSAGVGQKFSNRFSRRNQFAR